MRESEVVTRFLPTSPEAAGEIVRQSLNQWLKEDTPEEIPTFLVAMAVDAQRYRLHCDGIEAVPAYVVRQYERGELVCRVCTSPDLAYDFSSDEVNATFEVWRNGSIEEIWDRPDFYANVCDQEPQANRVPF